MATLADMVRQHRKRLDMTQDEFGTLVGISASMIAHVERGTRALGRDALDHMVQVLALNPKQTRLIHAARDRTANRLAAPRRGAPAVVGLEERVSLLEATVAQMAESLEVLLHGAVGQEQPRRRRGVVGGVSAAE